MPRLLITGNLRWTATPEDITKLKEYLKNFVTDDIDAVILTGNIADGSENFEKFAEIVAPYAVGCPFIFSLSNWDFYTKENIYDWNREKEFRIEVCHKYGLHWLHVMGTIQVDDLYIEGVDTWTLQSRFPGTEVIIQEEQLAARGITNISLASYVKARSILKMEKQITAGHESEDYYHAPYHMLVSWLTPIMADTSPYQYEVSGNNGHVAGTQHDNRTRGISIGLDWHYFEINAGGYDSVYSKAFIPMEGTPKNPIRGGWIVFDSSVADPTKNGAKILH